MIRLTNVQRMCVSDGPGIRTTVFLKGCSLHCPWCSNPENISGDIQNGYGRDAGEGEILTELLKDEVFWKKSGGGVTFSGGEPLLQMDRLLGLLQKLRLRGISVLVETALFVPFSFVKLAADYVDGFIVDVKILEPIACLDILGGDVKQYLGNVAYLYEQKKIQLFRIPCSEAYTLTEKNKKCLMEFISRHTDVPIEIFSLHRLAEAKYEALGMASGDYDEVAGEELIQFREEIKKVGAQVEIIKI